MLFIASEKNPTLTEEKIDSVQKTISLLLWQRKDSAKIIEMRYKGNREVCLYRSERVPFP